MPGFKEVREEAKKSGVSILERILSPRLSLSANHIQSLDIFQLRIM